MVNWLMHTPISLQVFKTQIIGDSGIIFVSLTYYLHHHLLQFNFGLVFNIDTDLPTDWPKKTVRILHMMMSKNYVPAMLVGSSANIDPCLFRHHPQQGQSIP